MKTYTSVLKHIRTQEVEIERILKEKVSRTLSIEGVHDYRTDEAERSLSWYRKHQHL